MLNLSISKENIHKRYKIKYSLKFLNEIESDKDVVLAEINSLQVKNISVIYQNQNECAIKIFECMSYLIRKIFLSTTFCSL